MRSLTHLLVPPLCSICADPCLADQDACAACLDELSAAPGGLFRLPGADAAWAATAYEATGRRLVTQLKFARRLRLARVAARAIAAGMPQPPSGAAVVPVPPDPLRRRLRGFDAAQAIARELAIARDLPVRECLVRARGRRQVGRSRADRLAAAPRVALSAPAPTAAVLLDDVVTTGATLAACAQALRAGGCGRLLAVAFAQA